MIRVSRLNSGERCVVKDNGRYVQRLSTYCPDKNWQIRTYGFYFRHGNFMDFDLLKREKGEAQ